MRLLFAVAALQVLLTQNDGASAFIIPSSPITFSTTTRLSAEIDPTDPYAKLLEAYQKKGSPIVTESSPPPPPTITQVIESPPPLPPPEVPAAAVEAATSSSSSVDTTSLADAVKSAASEAIQAAEKATSAAADVASSTAAAQSAAIKASVAAKSAAASVPLPPGKAPTLLDYLSDPQYMKKGLSDSSTTLENSKQKLLILKENLNVFSDNIKSSVKTDDLKGTVAGIDSTVTPILKSATAAAGGMAATASTYNVNELIESLHLKEYGSWYVSALSLFFAAAQRNAGRNAARRAFEVELQEIQKQADEAAEAARIAADGAKMAKTLAESLPEDIPNPSALILENSRYRQMEVEKEMMQKEMNKLAAATEDLRRQLAQVMKTAPVATESVSTPTHTEIPVVQETLERDPDEDARILNIIKEIDQANASSKETTKTPPAKKATKAKKAPAKKKTAPVKKVVTEMEAEIIAIDAKKEAAMLAEKVAEEEAAVAADALFAAKTEEAPATPVKKVTKKVKKAKKTKVAKKKAAAPKAAKSVKTQPAEVVSEEVSEEVPKEASIEVMMIDNPWGSLKESTLKRKTVAQLKEYLKERDVSTTSGMTKAELVDTVQRL